MLFEKTGLIVKSLQTISSFKFLHLNELKNLNFCATIILETFNDIKIKQIFLNITKFHLFLSVAMNLDFFRLSYSSHVL